MNRVDVSADDVPVPLWSKSLQRYAIKVLEKMGRDKWDLSILLCGDKTIAALNAQYRGKAEATDVLSFCVNTREGLGGRIVPGDIVISLDSLKKNAGRFHISEDEELRRLLIHGILHLDGMDHHTNTASEPMLRFQEQILSELAQEHIVEGVV